MRCLKCGAGNPWIYESAVYTPEDGYATEWACQRCGSRKIEREEGEMARTGKCTVCGRDNISLPVKGMCGKCYLKARKEKKAKPKIGEAVACLLDTPPGFAVSPSTGINTADAVKASFKADAASVTKYPPAPSNGNGLFPPLTLTFEERDAALVDFIEEDATKHRRTPDQHILWILEQHYESLLHTS